MSELQIPAFGALLAPYISQVPADLVPRFLALLERGAATRYREWAEMLPDHAEILLACAADEDEIADRIDGAFALEPQLRDQLHAPLAGARDTYYATFEGYDVWDQLRIQANAERQGANAWRGIATRTIDTVVREQLATCSALEEASADRLDALIATHAP